MWVRVEGKAPQVECLYGVSGLGFRGWGSRVWVFRVQRVYGLGFRALYRLVMVQPTTKDLGLLFSILPGRRSD